MDFALNSEQTALQDSLERFVDRDYDWDRRLAVIRSATGADPAHWAAFADLGWLGAGLSEEAGGFGGGAVENALILETFGRALVVEPMIANIVAVNILARSDGLAAADLLAAAISGDSRLAVAHAEAEDGIAAIQVGVGGDPPVLTGEKVAVDGAALADRLIVSAIGPGGDIGLYLIDPKGPGVTLKPYRTLDNRRVADIRFDAAPVIGADLAAAGSGAAMLDEALDWGVAALCAEAVGAMDSALFMTRDYLQTRQQFGVAIGGFQVLQHRMADMLIETEMSRSILFLALGALESGDPLVRRRGVSAAKVAIASAGVKVGAQAIQLHGGMGVTEEHRISHYYRRLFAIARLLGTEHQHLSSFIEATDSLDRRLAQGGPVKAPALGDGA